MSKQKLKKKDLDWFRKVLLKTKEDILQMVRETKENGKEYKFSEVTDNADLASDSYERELLFELSNNERKMLNDINTALQKIDNKTFGKCSECGKDIKTSRLKAMPYAFLCISCQEKRDTIG